MAFSNLGRSKGRTAVVICSLSLTLVLMNSVYTIIDLFTNETNEMMKTIKTTIFNDVKYGLGSAMAWIYFICIAVILVIAGGLISRKVFYYDER